MTKATKNTNRGNRNTNGGRMTKVDGEAASVAPDTGSVSTDGTEADATLTDEQAKAAISELIDDAVAEGKITLTPTDGQPAPEPQPEPSEDDAEKQGQQEAEASLEHAAKNDEPAGDAVTVDPFADLPVIALGDYELKDLTSVEGNKPYKYESVHKEAREGKLHVKKGWKHSADMITMGRTHRDFKPSSVWGTIAQIVASYGRAGVPAAVLVAAVRQKQIGNKRSRYCEALPPIGWAEGWIDTFVSKGFGRTMEKKAPVLTSEEVAAEATQAAEKIAA